MVLPAIPPIYVVAIALSSAFAAFRLSKEQSSKQLGEILQKTREKFRNKAQDGEIDWKYYNIICDETNIIYNEMKKNDKEAIEVFRKVVDQFLNVYKINPLSILDFVLGKDQESKTKIDQPTNKNLL